MISFIGKILKKKQQQQQQHLLGGLSFSLLVDICYLSGWFDSSLKDVICIGKYASNNHFPLVVLTEYKIAC